MYEVKLGDAVEFLNETGILGPVHGDTGTVIEIDRHMITVKWRGGSVTIEELAGRSEDWRIIKPDANGYYSSWWCEEKT